MGTRDTTRISALFISPPFSGIIYGSNTMLQAERSLVQILMGSLDFSIYFIVPASLLLFG
jgi:hypothetical protein